MSQDDVDELDLVNSVIKTPIPKSIAMKASGGAARIPRISATVKAANIAKKNQVTNVGIVIYIKNIGMLPTQRMKPTMPIGIVIMSHHKLKQ